jgi:DNA-binding NarL/FixJ family response regulator
MSKMAELDWEIELRVCEGMEDSDIARELDIPVKMVKDWYKNLNSTVGETV